MVTETNPGPLPEQMQQTAPQVDLLAKIAAHEKQIEYLAHLVLNIASIAFPAQAAAAGQALGVVDEIFTGMNLGAATPPKKA